MRINGLSNNKTIIEYFNNKQLKSSKQEDFKKFKEAHLRLSNKEHLDPEKRKLLKICIGNKGHGLEQSMGGLEADVKKYKTAKFK